MTTINERLAILRKELNLTQEAFGEELGIKKSAVSKLESGINNVSRPTINSIVRYYHVNPDWLINGDGPMFNDEVTDDMVDIVFNRSDPFVKTWMKVLAHLPDKEWQYFKEQLEKVEEIRNKRS